MPFVVIDPKRIKQLKRDVDGTQSVVAKAISAEQQMRRTAKDQKGDLSKPQALTDEVKARFAKVSSRDKQELRTKLDLIDTQRDLLNDLRTQIENAAAIITDRRNAQTKLLDEQNKSRGQPNDPDADKKNKFWDSVGEWLEHFWDLWNSITNIDTHAGNVVKAVVHALAGTDFVKDAIKEQIPEIAKVKQEVDDLKGTVDRLTSSLADDAVRDVQTQKNTLKKLFINHGKAVAHLQDDVEACDEALDTMLKDIGSDRSKAGPMMSIHQAVVDAYNASENALTALDQTSELSDKLRAGWLATLVPLGRVVQDGSKSKGPGTIPGDLVVYQKGGKQFGYRETRSTMEAISSALAQVGQVTKSGTEIQDLYEAWSKAYKKGFGT